MSGIEQTSKWKHGHEQVYDRKELKNGEIATVPLRLHKAVDVAGGQIVAKLFLGGYEKGPGDTDGHSYPVHQLQVVSVRDVNNPHYRTFVERAVKADKTPSRLLLFSVNESGYADGVAFLPLAPQTVGRGGYLRWFKTRLDQYEDDDTDPSWNPMAENNSISADHVRIEKNVNEELEVRSLTESDTSVEAPEVYLRAA